jgi:hypothetical protein
MSQPLPSRFLQIRFLLITLLIDPLWPVILMGSRNQCRRDGVKSAKNTRGPAVRKGPGAGAQMLHVFVFLGTYPYLSAVQIKPLGPSPSLSSSEGQGGVFLLFVTSIQMSWRDFLPGQPLLRRGGGGPKIFPPNQNPHSAALYNKIKGNQKITL